MSDEPEREKTINEVRAELGFAPVTIEFDTYYSIEFPNRWPDKPGAS